MPRSTPTGAIARTCPSSRASEPRCGPVCNFWSVLRESQPVAVPQARIASMATTRALHAAMDEIDQHKEVLGSGPYCEIANRMKAVAQSMEAHAAATKRAFAMDLMLDVPACAAASSVFGYTEDAAFMDALVQRKSRELQAYDPHVAALMGHSWKIEMTEVLLPYHHNNPCMLCDVRHGVLALLELRSGFLPQIVGFLTRKGITPQMLCPLDMSAVPVPGDEGHGPGAKEFLGYEPRLLRWLLGVGELEPWPQVLDDGSQSFSVSELIVKANRSGGDDPSINEHCDCPSCAGVRIPTLDRSDPPPSPPVCDLGASGEDVP